VAVHGNLSRVADAAIWHSILFGNVTGTVCDEDKEFISQAALALPEEPWDETTWKTWTNNVKNATERKGKQLFMPLRLALTGLDHGPEFAAILPLMGRKRVAARLART
jgi:glutamyl-tRNA synthetase